MCDKTKTNADAIRTRFWFSVISVLAQTQAPHETRAVRKDIIVRDVVRTRVGDPPTRFWWAFLQLSIKVTSHFWHVCATVLTATVKTIWSNCTNQLRAWWSGEQRSLIIYLLAISVYHWHQERLFKTKPRLRLPRPGPRTRPLWTVAVKLRQYLIGLQID